VQVVTQEMSFKSGISMCRNSSCTLSSP